MTDLAAVENKPETHSAEEAIEGLPAGFGNGLSGRIAFWIAFTFSLFQLWSAAYGTLPSQVVRAMHVGFLLLLGFALFGNLVAKTKVGTAWFWLLGILGFLTGIYQWVNYGPLIHRSGFLTTTALVGVALMLVLVCEGARRLMGLPLTLIAGIFLAYCFFGQYLPAPFYLLGYPVEMIMEHF